MAAAWPLTALGQRAAMPTIGYFSGRSAATEAPLATAFLQGLAELGCVEGRDVAIDYRLSDGQVGRLPALAAELLGRQVDMLVAADGPSALAARPRPLPSRSSSRAASTRWRPVWSPASADPAAMPRE